MEHILAKLQEMGYGMKPVVGKRIQVLVDGHRPSIMGKIAAAFGGCVNPDPRKGSSLGCVEIPGSDCSILVKPASRQGSQSAGITNETFLVDTLNQYLNNGVKNFKFKNGDKELVCRDVISVEMTGRDTKSRKKSDVRVNMADGSTMNFSVKKDNAECWESADTFARDITKTVLEKALADNLVEMKPIAGGVFKLSKNIAWRATKEQALDVVFGSDLNHKNGAVIIRTFTATDFQASADTVEIEVSGVLSELTDLEERHHVYFLIRNDRSRISGVAGFPGIRVLAVTKSRITKNVIEL